MDTAFPSISGARAFFKHLVLPFFVRLTLFNTLAVPHFCFQTHFITSCLTSATFCVRIICSPIGGRWLVGFFPMRLDLLF
ncbi:hypothetical protein FB567DRAFT_87302 [Paraphoma chrysanthemicola]|uniref:Uncharacterized protein n=1 Tax=Paraphoma chrysanthemicola TaxID=798071 RepID=A0A8K0R1U0_9PLEO|nr:hypothetical protein FB567DRAFT_87302 [Paraphoma chrysanthemicola]